MSGLVKVKFGDEIKPVAIEKYRGDEGSFDVISVLSEDILASLVHFHPNTGFFYCFKGACDQHLGLPSVRYNVPIVRYTIVNPNVKNLAQMEWGAPIFVNYLSIGKDSYTNLMLKKQLIGDMRTRDMLVTCSDAQYQKLQFEILGDTKWRKEPALQAMVKELADDYTRLIELSIARNLTEESMLELLAQPEKARPARPGAPPARPQIAKSAPAAPSMSMDLGSFNAASATPAMAATSVPVTPVAATAPAAPVAGATTKAQSSDFDFDSIVDEPKK